MSPPPHCHRYMNPTDSTRRKVRSLSGDDALLLRWVLLSVPVLLATVVMMFTGAFEHADTAQLTLLCGAPFYMEAEATQYSALTPAATFGICVGCTLYLGLVLLRLRAFAERLQVGILAVVAAALPGVLCVLWDCVFYAAPVLFCVLLTWLLVVSVPFFRNYHRVS